MRTTISIVTAVYNGEKLLPNLIKSIRQQSYSNFEFIVIDGGSKDGTVDIIRQNSDIISSWISEKDKGIYDAWNKGLARSTGEWLMFLGCDDRLLPEALEKYAAHIESNASNLDFVSSKMQMVDKEFRPIRIKGWPWEWPKFLNEMTVAHPGALHSRRLFEQYGTFDTNYKIVGDYEFLLRPKNMLRASFMDEITVVMQEGGASDSMQAIKEHLLATTTTGSYPKVKAYGNAVGVLTKYLGKKLLRRVGVNAYLKN